MAPGIGWWVLTLLAMALVALATAIGVLAANVFIDASCRHRSDTDSRGRGQG